MTQQTILVTGGSGFIGVETCKQLVAAGYNVINIDRKKKDIEGVTQYPFDISNSQVKGIITLTRPDAIIHLAAEHEVERSFTEPDVYFHNNISNTIELLNHAAEAGVNKFIFASSSSIYGERTFNETGYMSGSYEPSPFKESEKRNPLSPYSKSKAIIEGMLVDYEKAYGMKHVILRYHNVAGASKDLKHGYTQKPHAHLIPIICRAIINNETVLVNGGDTNAQIPVRKVTGMLSAKLDKEQGPPPALVDCDDNLYDTWDGTCLRDYTHLVDVARSHINVLEYMEDGKSDTFNIGAGDPYTVLQVLDKFEKVVGKKPEHKIVGKRQGDPSRTHANRDKAKKKLKWEPTYTIDDIILDAYNWELKQK